MERKRKKEKENRDHLSLFYFSFSFGLLSLIVRLMIVFMCVCVCVFGPVAVFVALSLFKRRRVLIVCDFDTCTIKAIHQDGFIPIKISIAPGAVTAFKGIIVIAVFFRLIFNSIQI